MKKYYIYRTAGGENDKITSVCEKIRDILGRGNETAGIPECDVIIAVGGDGAILRVADKGKPVLGVNMGRVGFLAAFDGADFNKAAFDNCVVSERMLLEISYRGRTEYALNDAVFSRARDTEHARLPLFCVRRSVAEAASKAVIARFRGDGLIISTPTGSTAYSLSAGGALIEPELRCMQYTPVCPHTFNARPILLSADSFRLEISIEETGAYDGDKAYYTADGNPRVFFVAGEVVTVAAARQTLRLLRAAGDCFFDTVREKISGSAV